MSLIVIGHLQIYNRVEIMNIQGMQCSCGSSDIAQNDQGNNYCMSCGMVVDTMKFSNNVTFANLQMAGQVVNINEKNNQTTIEKRMRRAKDKIQQLQKLLQIGFQYEEAIDAAIRIIKYANDYNFFDKGRNVQLYAATALYTTLRFKKAPYLLIDFSDKMNQNLFKLGRCFLKMSRFLGLQDQLPLIDPSLFIHRYCRMLDLGSKTTQITNTAIRLVQRMKRDWICQGRRPSSLCGAAILISTKIHDVKCSTNQICKTVFVCDETIRRRLEEFKQTSVAKLTREQFQKMQNNLDDIEGEMDPPAFTKARLRSKLQNQRKQQAIRNQAKIAVLKKQKEKFEGVQWSNYKNDLNIPEDILSGEVKEVEQALVSAQENYIEDSSQPIRSITEDEIFNQDSDQQLQEVQNSQIKQDEVDKFILTQEEQKVKKNLWKKINKNWLEKEQAKRKKAQKQPKRKSKSIKLIQNENPFYAVKNTKIGDAVNDQELKKLLASEPKKINKQSVNLNNFFNAFTWKA